MSTTSSANFRNPARYIEARQREHPPIYQSAAGWQGLFGGALTFVAPIMQARTRRGMIGGGEVGELTPVASVTEVGSGYAIEMHSGLMRLIYSAARAFLAGDDGHLAGIEPTAALSVVQIAEKIADLFENYKVHQIATAQIFPVTEAQRDWANIITIHAETFLLMHELAHIYNEHSFWRFFGKKKANDYEREIQADSTASQWLIDYLLNPKPGSSQPQMFYAGAEFGLRVRMAMETAGMHFKKTHPSAGDRIQALRKKLRAIAGSRRFYAIANTSLAFDQMWRAVEKILLHEPPVFERTLDELLASMSTLVSELMRDGDVNNLISINPVEGRPDAVQVMLDPKGERNIGIVKTAQRDMIGVNQDLRNLARAHADDVFEPGSIQYSLLLALLN